MMIVSEELFEKVKSFTDAGQWKHSWHWERDNDSASRPISLRGAKQMLRDLQCHGDPVSEIVAAVALIQERYELADKLRELICRAEIAAEVDSQLEAGA